MILICFDAALLTIVIDAGNVDEGQDNKFLAASPLGMAKVVLDCRP